MILKAKFLIKVAMLGVLTLGPVFSLYAAEDLSFQKAGWFDSGVRGDEGVLEIGDYDPSTKQLFVTSNEGNLWILDISKPEEIKLVKKIALKKWGKGATSVSVNNGIVAVSVEAENKQAPGKIAFFDNTGKNLAAVEVGALPDMVIFSHDGRTVLAACEGEPSDDYQTDPEGVVAVIDMSRGASNVTQKSVTLLDFKKFNNNLPKDVKISPKAASAAQDIEPEYIAVTPDDKTAFVSLQENNAFAVVDIAKKEITAIIPLGFKDHSKPGNALDASNKDGKINIRNWPVSGMYQPDAIKAAHINGKNYIVSANEGDARDYDGYSEEARVKDLKLDTNTFPNAAWLQKKQNLGRLKITTELGDANKDGKYEKLFCYGARSFSIWDESGKLVFDSGDEFEKITAQKYPRFFNTTEDESKFDDRSDDKGPEPEGVAIGKIGLKTYAFICLERIGGVMVYDITHPKSAQFVTYTNSRNFLGDYKKGTALDFSPEGIVFIDKNKSPDGEPMLVLIHEMSGTVTLYDIVEN